MLTIDDTLDLEWPGPPAWSHSGRYLATLVYEDDGNALCIADLESAAGGENAVDTWRFRPDDAAVTEFAWSPTAPHLVCTTDDGETILVTARDRTSRVLASSPDDDSDVVWAPDGTRIALYRDGQPRVRHIKDGTTATFDVPERGEFLGGDRLLAWSEDDRLAFRFVEHGTTCLGVIDLESGELLWRTRSDVASSAPLWLDDGRLCYERREDAGAIRAFVAVDVPAGEETVLFREEDRETGALSRGSPELSPDGRHLAACLPIDGYEHVHVIDLETGERTQLTDGAFEDKGLADSSPRWLDSRTVVFASNRQDRGQRHLYAATIDGEVTPLVETRGTTVRPRPAPDGTRLAVLHASRDRSTETHVWSLEGQGNSSQVPSVSDREPRRVTRSAVEEWPVSPIEPERLTFASDEFEIDGYLLDPRRFDTVPDDATDLPSVVYVHGGPMRQMRDGFHPGRAYGLAYAIQQYLATKGYVGLLINSRGGIGHGREFRSAIGGQRGRVEMADIVRGADALRDLEYTSDRVGLWGLSYGGYAALQLPGTHPGTFDVTVNLAGVADLENYREWATETKFPAVASAATLVMGNPHEARDRWADASPVNHLEALETPLYSFHGTADRSVNVEQLDLVVDRLLDIEPAVRWEAEYYPDEAHVFARRATWKRTVEKLEAAFDRHLTE